MSNDVRDRPRHESRSLAYALFQLRQRTRPGHRIDLRRPGPPDDRGGWTGMVGAKTAAQ
jgi:hypothetical protein